MPQLTDIPIVTQPVTEGKKPSVPADVTKAVLESKRPRIAEIELTLFENCNIVCDFCHHDKKSTVGMTREEMFSKLPIVEKFIRERASTVDFMQVNIVGGELFQDPLINDGILSIYADLVEAMAAIAREENVPFQVVFVTNMLFSATRSVKGMLDWLRSQGIPSHLICSYDFDGRPMSKRYRDNIEWFGPKYIISVNCVGTTESITNFMKGGDEYFDWLYDTFNVYFDDYIPDRGHNDLVPPDSLIYDWYKYVADNYPEIEPIATLLENEHNEMHCLSLNKITIFPDNRTSNCRWHRYDQDDFNTKLDMADNAGMMQNYIDELGCLSCEYFQRCGLRCFTQSDWKGRERDMQDPKCPMKAFFNYVTKGVEWTRN